MEDRKIKVLIVGSAQSVKGGITSVINRFLNYKWNNVEVELLPTYIEGSAIKKIIFFFKAVIKYASKLLKNNFDIAHIHMSYKGSFFRKLIIIKLSKLFNKKVILHLHGSEFEVFYNKSSKLIKKLIKNIFESSDSVIVLGESWKNIIETIAPKANISVFNNAVNIPDYTVKWNEDKINILFLGVLIKRKGIYDLIEAIRMLNEESFIGNNKLNFIIGGSGPEEEELKKKINEYNLNSCVEMAGWVNGDLKEELLKKSQIFVLPSYNEGLPMAILEAMSYGIPVLSTDVGSISEVVVDNKTGFVIMKNDYPQLALRIKDVIKDPLQWEKLSFNCKKTIIEEFNEDNYFKKIYKLYEEL